MKSGFPAVSYILGTPPLSNAMGGAVHNVCSFKTYNATASELLSLIGLPSPISDHFNLTVSTFEGITDGGPIVHRPQYAEFPNIPAQGGNAHTLSEYTITALGTSHIPLKPDMTRSDTTFHPDGTGATVASPPAPALEGLNAAINQHFVVTTKYKNAGKAPEVTLQIILNKATAAAFNAVATHCETPGDLRNTLLALPDGHALKGNEQINLIIETLTA